ncbi:MAG: metallophosphoesterase [Clostridia bacterium]|nr:metallophosphoesterase [Clostridia bacterium]
MVRILHMADLHLDSPFSLKSADAAAAMRQMLRGTFTSAVLYARTAGADLVLMPGDIFDTGFAARDTLALLCSEFEKNPGIRFIIAPGNHDPYKSESPWAKTDFPKNVYIFRSSSLSKISFDDLGCDVYGWAFTDETMSVDPLAVKPRLDPSRINVLCAHCELDGPVGGRYCSISKAELESAGFDFAALGHIHKGTDGAKRIRNTYYAYSGCLEGRSFDECGQKTALIAELSKKDGVLSADFKTRAFTRRRFETVEVDCSGCEDSPSLVNRINAAVRASGADSETSVRVVLRGSVPPTLVISEQFLRGNVYGVRYTEIEDRTEPTLDIERYASEPGIRGAFYRAMAPYLSGGSEEDRAVAARALKLGLEALNGRAVQ